MKKKDLGKDLLVKHLFEMVYGWGRWGVQVDESAPAFQDTIKALLAQSQKKGGKQI